MFTNEAHTGPKSVAVKTAKVLAGIAALFTIATSTVACNSEDAAVIGGTIAIVAGAIAIDSAIDHSDHRPTCHGGYRRQCLSIRDRFGRLQTDCNHQVWDSCASRYSAGNFKLASDSALAMSVPDMGVNQVALKFGLPLESAEKLTTALQNAAAGKTDALASLGLSNDELAKVATYQLPSDSALDKIAASLALSRSAATTLVQQLMNETRAQMADIKSAAWTACQSTGKWKTDANGGTCKSTSWSGCSPVTGATMCAAIH